MSFINWSEIYSIGDQTLDSHHQRLFDIVNQLHDELLGHKREEAVAHTIKALLDYAHYHFSEEEKVMKAVDFPEYEMHKAAHDEIIHKLQAYEHDKAMGNKESAGELYSFLLSDWLWKHILEMDKKIAPYIQGHALKPGNQH